MAKLVLSLNGNLANQYFIDQPTLRIGSSGDNEIVVNDSSILPLHATLRCVGEDHILEACGEPGGLVINGVSVNRRILQHLDTMQLGKYHLRYLNTRVARTTSLDHTMLINTLDREGQAVTEVASLPKTRANKVHFPAGYVRVLRSPDGAISQGHVIALDRVVTTFGTPGKKLMVLTRRPMGFFLGHVEGSEMPRLNQKSISGKADMLRDSDLIEGAGWQLTFHLGHHSS